MPTTRDLLDHLAVHHPGMLLPPALAFAGDLSRITEGRLGSRATGLGNTATATRTSLDSQHQDRRSTEKTGGCR